ncbi:MAG: hypothetical protein J7M20_01960 [Deltaproteobacteria bacterium]|nr:hypothetical protein [Deltaproteobacteria bacterium]
MDAVIKNYLAQTKVGRKQSYKKPALYPLLSTYSVGLEYLLLDETLRKKGNDQKAAFGIKFVLT